MQDGGNDPFQDGGGMPVQWLEPKLATRENTAKYGYFIDDAVVNPGLDIPFYNVGAWHVVVEEILLIKLLLYYQPCCYPTGQ